MVIFSLSGASDELNYFLTSILPLLYINFFKATLIIDWCLSLLAKFSAINDINIIFLKNKRIFIVLPYSSFIGSFTQDKLNFYFQSMCSLKTAKWTY